jgi:hypothetical protein
MDFGEYPHSRPIIATNNLINPKASSLRANIQEVLDKKHNESIIDVKRLSYKIRRCSYERLKVARI